MAADPHANIDEIVQIYYMFLDLAIPGNKCAWTRKSCFPRNTWYTEDCKIARKSVHEYGKMHDLEHEIHRNVYHTLKKEYKRITQKSKRADKRKRGQEIEKMLEVENNERFWKSWQKLQNRTNQCDIPIDTLLLSISRNSKSPPLMWNILTMIA